MQGFKSWFEAKQWAVYDPHTDVYTSDEDQPHIAAEPDPAQVDAIIAQAMNLVRKWFAGHHVPHYDVRLGDIEYESYTGQLIKSRVLFRIEEVPQDQLPFKGIGDTGYFVTNGHAHRKGSYEPQGTIDMILNMSDHVKKRKNQYARALWAPPGRGAAGLPGWRTQVKSQYEEEQKEIDAEWAALSDKVIPLIQSALLQILYHEMGHHQRPHLQSNREGREQKLFGKSIGGGREGQYLTKLPDEWDTETSMMVRLFQRLPPEQQQKITYRELIGMNHRGSIFLRSPQRFQRTIDILKRKGVHLDARA